jgi:hypothetical protein
MKFDIELPQEMIHWLRRILSAVLTIGAIAGLVLLGKSVSPVDAKGRPIFLSPRLAQISAYQQNVRHWAANLKEIQSGLAELLSKPNDNILNLDQHANLLYGRLVNLQAELDGTSVPSTLDVLHASITDAVNASLETALLVAAWISEPDPNNLHSAESGLSAAMYLLDNIYQNPWVEKTP